METAGRPRHGRIRWSSLGHGKRIWHEPPAKRPDDPLDQNPFMEPRGELVVYERRRAPRVDLDWVLPFRFVARRAGGEQAEIVVALGVNRLLNVYVIVWWRNRLVSWRSGSAASAWSMYNVSESWRREGNRGICSQSFSSSRSLTESRE